MPLYCLGHCVPTHTQLPSPYYQTEEHQGEQELDLSQEVEMSELGTSSTWTHRIIPGA